MKAFFIAILPLVSLLASQPGFEKNLGQAPGKIEFFSRQGQGFVSFSRDGIVFTQPAADGTMHELFLELAGTQESWWRGQSPSGEHTTYHLGADPKRWIEAAPNFARIERKAIYPGIDLIFYYAESKLEYDFIVHPGADPSRIRIRSHSELDSKNSNLTATLGAGAWTQRAPHIYQNTKAGKQKVAGGLRRCGPKDFCFFAQSWNRGIDLMVDPILEFSSYLGGEGADQITAIGSGILAGSTTSVSLLGAAPGARRQRDIMLRFVDGKLSNTVHGSDGLTLVLGGSGDDQVTGVSPVNVPTGTSSFAIVSTAICGTTSSTDLFASSQNFKTSSYAGGASDAFVMYISMFFSTNPVNPSQITVTGTYFGGSGADRANSILFFGGGLVVAGDTDSTDLPLIKAIQSVSGGQIDAFIAGFPLNNLTALSFSTYWGGSGDDTALSIAYSANPASFYFGGETSSPRFPGLDDSLSGPSDAYIIELGPFVFDASGVRSEPQIMGAIRIGGDGEDRITGLAFTTSGIYFGGHTTSSNLPVKEAHQSIPGGGVDSFVGRMRPNSLEVSLLSYIGGSGDDRLLSLASNFSSEVAFGGITTSPNLKLLDPLQSELKGSSDGFFGAFTGAGELRQLSYFGGTGDDRVNAVQVFQSGLVRIAGATSSQDLPIVKPWLRSAAPGEEAFVADISSDTFNLPVIAWLANRYNTFVALRSASKTLAGAIKIRIADPSIAGIVTGDSVVPEASINFLPDPTRIFYLGFTPLAESGQTSATVEIPGFGTRTIQLRIGKSGFRITAPNNLDTFSTRFPFTPLFVVLNPDNDVSVGNTIQMPRRQDAPPLFVRYVLSDPTILSIDADQYPPNSLITAHKSGVTTVTVISSDPILPSNSFEIGVNKPSLSSDAAPQIYMTNGEVRQIGLTTLASKFRFPSFFTGRFRIESEDPAKLQVFIGTPQTVIFGASKEADFESVSPSSIYVQFKALSSVGDVRIRISSDAIAEDFFLTISLRRITAQFGIANIPAADRAILPVSSNFFLRAQPIYEGTSTSPSNTALGTISVFSSNPVVIANSNSPIPLVRGAFGSFSTLTAGNTALRFQFSNPDVSSLNTPDIEVSNRAPVNLPPFQIRLGKDLMTVVEMVPPLLATGMVEVISNNPSLVQLQARNQSIAPSGEYSDRLLIPITGANGFHFTAIGMAGSGTTSVRVVLPSREDFMIPVTLGPSGFAFSVPYFAKAFHSRLDTALRINSYLLDESTLVPMALQALRPGLSASITISSDSPILRPLPATCTITNPNGCGTFPDSLNPGISNLTIDPVAGFTSPSYRNKVEVEVRASAISLNFGGGIKDALSRAQLQIEGAPINTPVTITSVDPSKALLSLSPTAIGQPTITANHNALVYLHGLVDSGIATFRLTGAKIEAQDVMVAMAGLRISAYPGSFSGPAVPATILRGTKVTTNIVLDSTAGVSSSGLRPGVPSIPLNIENSNPALILIRASSPAFIPGESIIEVTFEAVADGQTEIAFSAGSLNRIGPYRVNTRRPGLRLQPVLAGRSLVSFATVKLEPGARPPSDNSLLMIRSLDPSRLLVGRTSNSQGTAAVSIVWSANTSVSEPIFLFPLASEGEIPIEFSSPEFESGRSTVYLTNSYFAFTGLNDSSKSVQLGEDSILQIRLAPIPRTDLVNLPDGIQISSLNQTFSSTPISIPIESSNPSILEITPLDKFESSQLGLRFRAAAVGNTTLSLGVPNGFAPPPRGLSRTNVTVSLPPFPIGFFPRVIHFESTQRFDIPQIRGRAVSVSSSNPAALLVSAELSSPAQASITLPANPGGAFFILHGLARSCNVNLTLSAAGYEPLTIPYTCAPSSFALQAITSNFNPDPLRVGQTMRTNVQFVTLNAEGRPVDLVSNGLRPNTIPVTVRLTVSDPSVLKVTPLTVTFNPGDSTKEIMIEGLKAGSSLIETSVPTGFATPSLRAVLYRVIAP